MCLDHNKDDGRVAQASLLAEAHGLKSGFGSATATKETFALILKILGFLKAFHMVVNDTLAVEDDLIEHHRC